MKTSLQIIYFILFGIPCFSQSLILPEIKNPLCNAQEYYLHFQKEGNFEENDEFVLYRLLFNGDSSVIAKTKADSILVTPTFSSDIFIKSSISNISSNTINMFVDSFTGVFLKYENEPICNGFSNEIEIYSGLQDNDEIFWSKNKEIIQNAKNAILFAQETGIYEAEIKRGSCFYSVGGTANIEVGHINEANLSISHSPEVCDGFSVEINASIPNILDINLQWLFDGDSIIGASSLIHEAKKSGQYQLHIQQGSCTSISKIIEVKVGQLKPGKIRILPIDAENGIVTVCEGLNLHLSINDYFGRDDIAIDWLKNGKKIDGQNNSSVFVTEEASYRYQLSQGNCKVLSEAITMEFGEMKGMDLYSLSGNEACESQTVNLLINPKNNTITNYGFDFELMRGNEVIGPIPYLFNFLRISQPGNYHVRGKFASETCVFYSDTTEVKFHENIVPFELNEGISTIQSCSDSTILGSQVNITEMGGPDVEYIWKMNESIIPNDNQRKINAKQNGNYQLEVKIDSTCKYVSKPISLELNKFEAQIVTEEALCANHLSDLSVVLGKEHIRTQSKTGGQIIENDLSFQWLLDTLLLGESIHQTISQSGEYRLKLINENCEIETEKFTANLIEISAGLRPKMDTLGICPEGGYVRLESAGIADYYQWLNDSLSVTSDSFSINASNAGTYQVWMEKDGCGVMSDSIIIVKDFELPTATISGGGQIENGESSTLRVNLTGSAPWTLTSPNTSNSIEVLKSPYFFDVSPGQTETYSITTVSNPCGFGETFGEAVIIVLVLGFEEPINNNIQVYPNPTSQHIQIKISNLTNEVVPYQLYDIQQKLIQEGEIIHSEGVIDFNNQVYGSYFLKLNIDGKVITRKIIKVNP